MRLFTWLTLAMSETFPSLSWPPSAGGSSSILLSPCHLSSIPLVIGYISSQGREGMQASLFTLAGASAIGILITIALVGVVTASAGRMMGDIGLWGNSSWPAIFFVMGLYLIDVITLPWEGFAPGRSIAGGGRGRCFWDWFSVSDSVRARSRSWRRSSVWSSAWRPRPLRALGLIAAFGIGHCGVIVGAGGAVGPVQRYLNWTDDRGVSVDETRCGGAGDSGGVYFVYTAL